MAYNVKMGWSKAEAKQLWKTLQKYEYFRQHPETEWKDIKVDDNGRISTIDGKKPEISPKILPGDK